MPDDATVNKRGSLKGTSFPVALLVVGTIAVLFGLKIQTTGFGEQSDVGPRTFPVLLGCLLVLGAIFEFAKSFRLRVEKAAPPDEAPEDSVPPEHPWRFWSILGVIIIYLPAIPYLGFFLSTVVFTCVMMRWLGTKWIASIISALMIALVVYGLFVLLFKVQLPGGLLFD